MKKLSKEAGVRLYLLFLTYCLQFFGFEIPYKALLTNTQFTVENDLLTPSFKLKRNEAKKFFFNEIKQLYGGAKLQGEDL